MTEPEVEARRISRWHRLEENLHKTRAALIRAEANRDRLQALLTTTFSDEHRERHEKALYEAQRVVRAVRRGVDELEYQIAVEHGEHEHADQPTP